MIYDSDWNWDSACDLFSPPINISSSSKSRNPQAISMLVDFNPHFFPHFSTANLCKSLYKVDWCRLYGSSSPRPSLESPAKIMVHPQMMPNRQNLQGVFTSFPRHPIPIFLATIKHLLKLHAPQAPFSLQLPVGLLQNEVVIKQWLTMKQAVGPIAWSNEPCQDVLNLLLPLSTSLVLLRICRVDAHRSLLRRFGQNLSRVLQIASKSDSFPSKSNGYFSKTLQAMSGLSKSE